MKDQEPDSPHNDANLLSHEETPSGNKEDSSSFAVSDLSPSEFNQVKKTFVTAQNNFLEENSESLLKENLESQEVSSQEQAKDKNLLDIVGEESLVEEETVLQEDLESPTKPFEEEQELASGGETEGSLDEAEQSTFIPSEEMTSSEESMASEKDTESQEEKEVSTLDFGKREDDSQVIQNTLFEENNDDIGSLAEIDFGFIESGRWLLKVIGGPNSGAEFYMNAGQGYVVGNDPKSCDIVLYDKTVSRQHAKLSVSEDEKLFIEDLGSKNGILLNGIKIEQKTQFEPGVMVALGTTSFVVYDREGEVQTIITPILPAIVKSLQKESTETASSLLRDEERTASDDVKSKTSERKLGVEENLKKVPSRGAHILLGCALCFFLLLGYGIYTLFHEEPVIIQTQENANELIQNALKPFPSIRWTFNKSNGSLLLLGHVLTNADRNQVLYNLDSLKFIKNIDANGLVIDEGVWNEINSLLANNSVWRGITIHSHNAGQFVLSGELQTRQQAEQLSAYLSRNFPYLDLLKKELLVEEDVVNQISSWLREKQLMDVVVKMVNGEVLLSGSIAPTQQSDLDSVIVRVKQINGVRTIVNTVQVHTAEIGTVDISDHYSVGGKSRIGSRFTVVINGRILSEGDELDGMTITKISAHRILLEKDNDKFRIDY